MSLQRSTVLRRLLKFLHSLTAALLTGGMAALAAVVMLTPASVDPAAHIPLVLTMAMIAEWIIAPSAVLTVATGLLAMAANPAYLDVGWVWAKAATGVLVLIGMLHVLGPIQEEARRAAAAVAESPDPANLAHLLAAETATLWVLLAVSIANIALGVWRPRFPKYPV